jgi:hypothetical protein
MRIPYVIDNQTHTNVSGVGSLRLARYNLEFDKRAGVTNLKRTAKRRGSTYSKVAISSALNPASMPFALVKLTEGLIDHLIETLLRCPGLCGLNLLRGQLRFEFRAQYFRAVSGILNAGGMIQDH